MSEMPGEIITELRAGWDDLQGDIAQGAANATLTFEVFRDSAFRMYFMRHDQDDTLNMSYQTTHGWNPTTDVFAHLHIIPMADPVSPQVIYFSGIYAWASFGKEVPAASGWTAFSVSHTVNPGDVNKEAIVNLFTAHPLVGGRESDVLLVQVKREGTNLSDTYTTSKSPGTAAANVALLSADVHYNRNKVGTESPIPS